MSADTTPHTPTPLPYGGLRTLLRDLGTADSFGNPAPQRTGRVRLTQQDGLEGYLWMRRGLVYSIQYDGFTPPVGRRLLTSGDITESEYATLAGTQKEDDETTIYMHTSASREQVESVNRQMLLSSLTFLYHWKDATWQWEDDVTTAVATISPLEPGLLVTAAEERLGQWAALERNYPDVCDPDAVPTPGDAWAETTEEEQHPESSAILALVDGKKSNMFIAGTVGLTRFELAGRLAQAVANDFITYAATPHHAATQPAQPAALDRVAELRQRRSELQQQLDAVDAAIAAFSD